jgi:CRISPR-associated protein Csb1
VSNPFPLEETVDIQHMYDRLAAAASLETDDGALRIRAAYEPGAGAGAKVSPPTYPQDNRDTPYIIEDRLGPDGNPEKVVLLDSRQSQANRCEEALDEAIKSGELSLPHIAMHVRTHSRTIRITSLTAPHRSRDAYFRDSHIGDVPFDQTPPGRALADASPADATAVFLYSPADLVFGVWDSHRGRRVQTKFPRVYTSELVGRGAVAGERAAGRYDMLTSGARKITGSDEDWAPDDKGKGKLSAVGLGSIPPSVVAAGGVTVRSIEREATLSFAGLARVRAGENAAQRRAARAVLASLAVLGDRLAFGVSAIFVRSGCDLVLVSESLSWVQRGSREEPIEITRADAAVLLDHAVDQARLVGLEWQQAALDVDPLPKLQRVIDEAFLAAPDKGE